MNFSWWHGGSGEMPTRCEIDASALTALFDGEATEAEAAAARAHLLVCARCADMWTSWNTTRFLYRKLPLVAPPGLLLRILMACRMVRSDSAAALPLPPRDLQKEILMRTSRAEPARVGTTVPEWIRQTTARPTRSRLSLGMRFAGTTAVPALLLFVSLTANLSDPGLNRDAVSLSSQPKPAAFDRSVKSVRAASLESASSSAKASQPSTGQPATGGRSAGQVASGSTTATADSLVPAAGAGSATSTSGKDAGYGASNRDFDRGVAADTPPVIRLSSFDGGLKPKSELSFVSHRPQLLPAVAIASKPRFASPTVSMMPEAAARTMRAAMVRSASMPKQNDASSAPLPIASTPAFASLNRVVPDVHVDVPAPDAADTTGAQATDVSVSDWNDLRSSRPEEVSRVLDTFRSALLDNGDDSATES